MRSTRLMVIAVMIVIVAAAIVGRLFHLSDEETKRLIAGCAIGIALVCLISYLPKQRP